MRVLLRLRKPLANKQSSHENLSELGLSEGGASTASVVTVVFVEDPSALSAHPRAHASLLPLKEASLGLSLQASAGEDYADSVSWALSEPKQALVQPQAPEPSSTLAAEKRTGLQGIDPEQKPPPLNPSRKRPRPSTTVDSPKLSATEAKPAAQQSSNNIMVLGGGNRRDHSDWLYDQRNESLGDNFIATRTVVTRNHIDGDPLLMENDPASARGDNSYSTSSDIADSTIALELKKRGFEIRQQDGDGNCLFRAVSLQVYGDPSMHGQVRKQCLDFMERDQEHFAQFVTDEAFSGYILRKRQDGVHGNNPEIQAISELFNRPIEVFSPTSGSTPLNIFHAEYKTDDAPIRLSYHDGNHYNAVVDPLVPTAGLGLGLPGLQPGLADKMQVAKAVAASDAAADQMELKRAMKESQDDELQRAIKESKLSTEHMHSNEAMALSDMDATYFELEQAALEHSLESFSTFEHGKKQRASSGGSLRRKADKSSPVHDAPSASVAHPPQCEVASLPGSSSNVASEASLPSVAAAAAVSPAVASAAGLASAKSYDRAAPIRSADEYPPVVQELVMNGFDLGKVVRAVELIGVNFDSLLAFLLSNTS